MSIFTGLVMQRCLAFTAIVAGLATGVRAGAQGSLGGQGFGYPTGQLSTRALGIGGSTGELDPVTPRNPASLSAWGRSGLHLQYDPEYKRVSASGGEDRTLEARFPLIAAGLQINRSFAAGISISTLLDRTFSTRSAETLNIGGTEVHSLTAYNSAGGLNDVRLGVAYTVSPTFRIGLAGHVVTGENRVAISTVFDRDGFLQLDRLSEVSYNGTAFSAGVTWLSRQDLAIGISGRLESSLRATRSDSTLRTGRLPSRAGLSVAYTGITGAVISAGADFEQWSSMDGLGSEDVFARDTREYGVGAEIEGPRVRGSVVALRGGYRWRTLPFGVSAAQFVTPAPGEPETFWLKENAWSLGAGIPLANTGGLSRAALDMAVQTASRTGTPGISERAWTFSVGLAVRP
jgi:hypothetical protein